VRRSSKVWCVVRGGVVVSGREIVSRRVMAVRSALMTRQETR